MEPFSPVEPFREDLNKLLWPTEHLSVDSHHDGVELTRMGPFMTLALDGGHQRHILVARPARKDPEKTEFEICL